MTLRDWLRDPFGRKTIAQKHEEILMEMAETTTVARKARERMERSFPISRTVGNPRLRREIRYEHSNA